MMVRNWAQVMGSRASGGGHKARGATIDQQRMQALGFQVFAVAANDAEGSGASRPLTSCAHVELGGAGEVASLQHGGGVGAGCKRWLPACTRTRTS